MLDMHLTGAIASFIQEASLWWNRDGLFGEGLRGTTLLTRVSFPQRGHSLYWCFLDSNKLYQNCSDGQDAWDRKSQFEPG